MGSASLGVLVRHVRVALCECLSSVTQPIFSTRKYLHLHCYFHVSVTAAHDAHARLVQPILSHLLSFCYDCFVQQIELTFTDSLFLTCAGLCHFHLVGAMVIGLSKIMKDTWGHPQTQFVKH